MALAQHGLASRREPISHVQTLGEPERLQLSDVCLEVKTLHPNFLAEVTGSNRRVVANQLENATCPGPAWRVGIELRELRVDSRQLAIAQQGSLAQGDPWVGPERSELDPIERALAIQQLLSQHLTRRVARSPRVFIRDVILGDLPHLDDSQLADRQHEGPTGANGGAAPASKRQRYVSVTDSFEGVLSKEHGCKIRFGGYKALVACTAGRTREDHVPSDASSVKWLRQPEDHDYAAAESYLTLTYPAAQAGRLVKQLRRARLKEFKAKDIFRASGLSLLGISNAHVERDRRKIAAGSKLSPLLLVRDRQRGRVIIADGYHRLCAVYGYDEDALIPCRIV